ncbi:hypothetical protein C500_09849 [Natrialba magadii ATCC 43099]|uniref:Secreted glycoprotein n=1 Tax=Natrialba magadii (strain ATCC 43099 / DSM 3394 / CCM 3739 / CIP 104546 / IAM 13178 / JCM 8861 / NBRC 102185 / NCIMB 2190 / MS3) TaxID=547559 RepID=L9UYG0_NATMM|nr:hypothetical protein [Natrialba magadii]ELY29904.1 hypothetical protein C500_09849 [Natrialba magadii ATCC 43099]
MSEPKSTRRTLFQLAGAGLVSAASLASNTAGATSDPDASLVFDEQTSDGTSITIAEASSSVDGMLAARSDETGEFGRTTIEAGTTIEDLTLEFSEPIGDDGEIDIAVSIYDGETRQGIAREVATVTFEDTVDVVPGVDERFVEADPSSGFNYPYYLRAGSTCRRRSAARARRTDSPYTDDMGSADGGASRIKKRPRTKNPYLEPAEIGAHGRGRPESQHGVGPIDRDQRRRRQ